MIVSFKMFYFCKYGIFLILLIFAGVYCYEDDDDNDVPGYGIYKVFISSKKDVSILTDMANNKVIYPMKKAAFEWKVLVRSNHEHYFQRRLIENNINYFVIQSSHTESLDLSRSNFKPIHDVNQNQQQEVGRSSYSLEKNPPNRKCFSTDPNCIPDRSTCFPTDPNCTPDRPRCFSTDPNCIPDRPRCFSMDPNCIPVTPHNGQNFGYPINVESISGKYPPPHYNPQIMQNPHQFSVPYYPQIQQGPYSYQPPPGNFYYCYYTGHCIPLAPFFDYSQVYQVQQKPYNQYYSNTMNNSKSSGTF